MPPFIVLALPRSRTAWLSRFLTWGDWTCGHEELRHLRSMDDVTSWFAQENTGTVETAAAPWWRLLAKVAPGVRIVTVRRPVAEVVDSTMRLPLPYDREKLTRVIWQFDRKLDQIERRVPGVLSVRFADLADETVCARIFEHCLPYRHDPAWWALLDQRNIQVNNVMLMRYFFAHKPQLEALAKTAKAQTLAAMERRPIETDGIAIRQEPFDTFYRDAVDLFVQHCMQVGDAPDEYTRKNLPLMRMLDDLGALQITTARSNGRMFGYLMTMIGPSLESPDIMSATNLTFFASKDVRGLGMRLQRASLDALRHRGITEVLFRAGTRGDGPRLSTLYRRLGAEPCGEQFLLRLH